MQNHTIKNRNHTRENKVETLRVVLKHPRFPAIAALLAVGLMLPSLYNGLNLVDNFHQLIMRGDTSFVSQSSSPINLFCMSDGSTGETERLMKHGRLPWWAPENTKVSFLRPLSALTHWLDYLLWPDTPALMHAQSLVWFGILVFMVTLFYRRILGVNWVAGVAALFFAVDDAHGTSVGWLANRSVLLASVFGILCLIAHDRWRRDGWQRGVLVAPFCFALSLLSAEAGIATIAYLLAYTLFLENIPLRSRIFSLIPCGCILFLWCLVYVKLGCGARGIPLYTNPLEEPLSYLVALFFRAPVYLLGQWGLPPSFCYQVWPSPMHKAGMLLTIVLTLILAPLIRRDRIARFWTAGMIMSLFPICAVMPDDRHLLFVGLGSMGLLAQWISWTRQIDWASQIRPLRRVIRTLLALFILVHGVIAPLSLPLSVRGIALLHKRVVRASASLPSISKFKNRTFVLLNPIHLAFVTSVIGHRAVQGNFTPLRVLTAGGSPLMVKRIDSHTITIQAVNGFLSGIKADHVRSKKFSMRTGQQVNLDDMSVQVLDVREGIPSTASFRFPVPLEDSSLAWFQWKDVSYRSFTPPPIGETVTIPKARFKWNP